MLWLKCESASGAAAGADGVDATWRIGSETMVLGPITSWCTVGETEISYEASRGDERWDYVINRRTGRVTLTHALSGRRTTTSATCSPIEDPQSGAKF